MAEKPMPFTTDEVKAILEGRKTQTRLVIKPQPEGQPMYCYAGSDRLDHNKWLHGGKRYTPPCHGDDILWVRETWCEFPKGGYHYRADYDTDKDQEFHQLTSIKWKSSLHMPCEAARIFLPVKSVRVERLQDITEEDAKAEGIEHCCPSQRHAGWNDKWIAGYCHDCTHHDPMTGKRPTCYFRNGCEEETRFQWFCGCNYFTLRDDNIPEPYRFKFAFVWDNKKKAPFWSQNPLVWVVELERVTPEG